MVNNKKVPIKHCLFFAINSMTGEYLEYDKIPDVIRNGNYYNP